MKTEMQTPDRYWHFLDDDRCLRYGERQIVVVGQTVKVTGELMMCERGLHASRRAIDALQYAPGPVVCRVTLGGDVLHDSDKTVGRTRTVLAMADATKLLHEFACDCARDALTSAKVGDPRCWNAIDTKMKWLRGEATDEELAAARGAARAAAREAAWGAARAAAREAARAAARAAAWEAAMAAAWEAAWGAAREAAWEAAWGAAMEAAWGAAWEEQNTRLEAMLKSLLEVADDASEGG